MELMIVTFIALFSAILFGYWLKRVEMLLRRPEQQGPILRSDLTRTRDLWNVVRSMFLPAFTS
jgi:hypothetical protein